MATATRTKNDKTDATKKLKTKYLIFTRMESDELGQWTMQNGTFQGYTPKQGIAAWAKTWSDDEPEYAEVAAVPSRQFVPRKVRVNTRVAVSFN